MEIQIGLYALFTFYVAVTVIYMYMRRVLCFDFSITDILIISNVLCINLNPKSSYPVQLLD